MPLQITHVESQIPNIALSSPSCRHWWVHWSISVFSGVADHVSEPQDIVLDFSFAEKQSFLPRGQLTSGSLPLVRADRPKTVINVSVSSPKNVMSNSKNSNTYTPIVLCSLVFAFVMTVCRQCWCNIIFLYLVETWIQELSEYFSSQCNSTSLKYPVCVKNSHVHDTCT